MLLPLQKRSLAVMAMCLLSSSLAIDVPKDTPVKELVASANSYLAQGSFQDALQFFDAAIKREPSNYLTIFKRGAAYLSLGKTSQAATDFDTVLNLKPDFEAALHQRARMKLRRGDWSAARKDFGGFKAREEDLADLDRAEQEVKLASEAEQSGDHEACAGYASSVLNTAPQMLMMRELRAKCRLHRGEVPEAIGDWTHVTQISPAALDPHLKIANLLYYSLNDYDRSVAQLRKCLHFDPESKPCKKAFRRIKQINKDVTKAKTSKEKKQFITAARILVGTSEDIGVVAEVEEEVKSLLAEGLYNDNCPNNLMAELKEIVCESYTDGGNEKKARPYCEDALKLNPNSIPALLSKANRLLSEDLFDDAISVLNQAKEINGQDQRVNELLNKANTLLKRSKQKDYYKVLGVHRESTDREIKKAYRAMTKQYHPDKIVSNGMTKEQAEKKMASVNEAYEVLSDPELRARFDRGDDPNSQENPFQQGGHPFGQGFGGQQQFVFRQGGHQQQGFPGGSQFKFHFG